MGITNRFASEAFVIDKLNDLGGTGNGSSIQGDWSQNDSTSSDYIKNRTHYSEIIFTEIVPETTVDLNYPVISTEGKLIEGQTYFVNYNGENYECTAISFEIEEGILFTAIGNIEGTSNEPFVIGYIAKEYEAVLGFSGLVLEFLDDSSEATLSIVGSTEHIQKLDNKFLDLDWKAVNSNIEIELLPETIAKNGDGFSEINLSSVAMVHENIIFYVDNNRIEAKYNKNSMADVMIGNKYLINSELPNSGESYAILMNPSLHIYFNDSNNHTLSVKTYQRIPMPEKYLPASIYSLNFRNQDQDQYASIGLLGTAFSIKMSSGNQFNFMSGGYNNIYEISSRTLLPLERKKGQILSCASTGDGSTAPIWIDPPTSSTIQMITWEAND